MPDTAWDRARRDAFAVFGDWHFGVVVGVSGLFLGALAVTRTHPNDAVNISWVVIYSIIGLIIPFTIVLLFQRLKAPGRQRDDETKRADALAVELASERVGRVALDRRIRDEALREAVHYIQVDFQYMRQSLDQMAPSNWSIGYWSSTWPREATSGIPAVHGVIGARRGMEEAFWAVRDVYSIAGRIRTAQGNMALIEEMRLALDKAERLLVTVVDVEDTA